MGYSLDFRKRVLAYKDKHFILIPLYVKEKKLKTSNYIGLPSGNNNILVYYKVIYFKI
ncbi:hypothetical protein SAMN05421784_1801 [Xenorhabdus koppenhoeferi]|uniref:Uncharacterized protein n=1 Tax=Xenorhabdus koppenhoeferi TaxID=351659 RepID=A0A1I7KMI7_9GAMM|nr:hypothetical protein SAMN05421784_1801 [Xenorhabdus koppenhoeferi]